MMCAARLGMDRPIHSLTVLMIRGSATAMPRMRVKAAEARYLLPIVRETLATCFATDTQHARGRLHCVDALLSCYRVLDEWNSTASPAQELVRAGRRFLILLRELHDSCPDARRWRLYPKHHLFVHLIEGAVINPRDEWNYGDESEIGDAVNMSKFTSAKHLATALSERYRSTFVL